MKKGPRHEAAVVEWLRSHGFPLAERRVMGGRSDKGDVAGIPGVVLECKNCVTAKLAEFVDEARTEAANAGASVWAVVMKRPGKGDPGESYVVMNLAMLADLLADALVEAAAPFRPTRDHMHVVAENFCNECGR